MPNDRLRDALMRQRVTPTELAQEIGVDPKTVERWITIGRNPYARYRHAISARLGEPEAWLWPGAQSPERAESAARAELVQLFARRASIPSDFWLELVSESKVFIDLLVYAGLFLPEQTPAVIEMLSKRAREGARVRVLLGDANSVAVALRGEEEGIGDAVGTKSRNALSLIHRFVGSAPVQIRLHDTTLYTSIYRGDDDMIANPHVLGLPAAQAPALHLRRISAGGLFDTYAAMFDRVWDGARSA